MSDDDKILQFPGAGKGVIGSTPTPPAGDDPPMSVDTYESLAELSKRATVITEAQAKAIQMILGDHAFVCISMGPDGSGAGADIRTAVGGNREMIKAVANGAGQGLHGVLSRLLDREDLL